MNKMCRTGPQESMGETFEGDAKLAHELLHKV